MANVTTGVLYDPGYSPYFRFEQEFDIIAGKNWFKVNWLQSLYYIVAYLLFLVVGQKLMKNRNSLDVTNYLTVWNITLSVFSTIGALRTIPELLYVLKEYGLKYSVCNKSHLDFQVTTCWNCLFLWCKVPELGDTVFLVLRKQKVIFLHWFHHAMSIFVCWCIGSELVAVSRWYAVMNLTCHSMMYTYYALKAMKIYVPRAIAMFITASQILQMLLGCSFTFWSYGIYKSYKECDVTDKSFLAATFAYTLYFGLFIDFFYKAYIASSSSRTKNKTT